MQLERFAKVIVIGGAPGAGKTTLGAALAVRLRVASLTLDDVMTATQTVTSPTTHPGLHALRRVPFVEYFTNSTVEQLKEDALTQHAAMWPAVESIIRKRAAIGPGIVIDGWHMRPERIVALNLPNVHPVWLFVEPAVLRAREDANREWLSGSSDPERMLHNFVARSLWYNELIATEARAFGMPVLVQGGDASVEQLCDAVITTLGGQR